MKKPRYLVRHADRLLRKIERARMAMFEADAYVPAISPQNREVFARSARDLRDHVDVLIHALERDAGGES